MKKISLHFAAALAALGLSIATASAVSTSHWVQSSETDFKAGTTHNVVVSNLGDIKLSRAVQTIQEQDPKVTSVNALAQGPDGVVYAGTGPKGVLLSVKNDKVDTVATFDDAVSILSLLVDDKGGLLVGTGGDKGKILRIDKPGDKPHEIFSEAGVQYIWSIVETPDGNLYAATGPNAQLFEIKPDGSHTELYKNGENNLTSLVSDGKDLLYIGTDPDGLVVRVNRKTKESFVLYNAPESEITALVLAKDGNLYAGTGEAGDRQPPQQPPAQPNDKAGRPDSDTNGSNIPSPPPQAPPKPPDAPDPNPGEPRPIPKKTVGMIAVDSPIFADDDPTPPDNPNPPAGGPGAAPDASQTDTSHQGAQPATPTPSPDDQQRPPGNAIYKIDKDGFVTEIFREPDVIYSMIEQNGVLLVGTGGDGNIYQVNPAAEETVVLAKVDAKQIMSLLAGTDGRIFMGLANSGGISAMTSGFATDGYFSSPVLDATQVSRFGKINLHGFLPEGTTLKVSTRSGNVKDADSDGWSKWTDPVDAVEYVPVTSPTARFLQYRLSFATTDAAKTAVVDHVDVAYQIPNLAPVIKSVKIGTDASAAGAAPGGAPAAPGTPPAPKPQGTGTQTITWDASDPNNDALTYTLYFRQEHRGPWILLKDNLKDATFDWDTRTVADGRYQIKVIASDALANPPGTGKTANRVSDYYVVSNTSPTIGDLTDKLTGNSVKIDLRAQARTGIISAVEYTIDSSDDWQTVLPVDNIYDSPDETVSFSIDALAPGSHQITIRATDNHGNQALETVVVKTEGPTARSN